MMKQAPFDRAEQRKRLALSIIDVLMPSAFGTVMYVAIFALTVLVNQPSQYKATWQTVIMNGLHSSFIYSYSRDFANIIKTQAANTITLYAFWIIIGVGIYLLGARLTTNINELAEDISLRQYIWPQGADRNSPLKQFLEKAIYHLAVAIIFLVYLSAALPLVAARWRQADLAVTLNLASLKLYLPLFALELLFLHLAVVLVRLLLIKRRIISY